MTIPPGWAELPLPSGGTIGIARCPGRDEPVSDAVDRIASAGITAVVTLTEQEELERVSAADLGARLARIGIAWHHHPIRDFGRPDAAWCSAWAPVEDRLIARLAAGEHVLIHCFGGQGRSGMVAARLLVALGIPPSEAVDRVRSVRPGAIETAEQEAWVRAGRLTQP